MVGEIIYQLRVFAIPAIISHLIHKTGYNLGSGGGYSVSQVIKAAAQTLGRDIPIEVTARRAGDPKILVADIAKAERILKWKPTRDINAMVSDAWEALNASAS